MKELIQMIARALVDRPELVNVESVKGGSTSILKVSVGVEDTGKVIGKKGRTANALRTILKAVAAKEKKRVALEIEDNLHRPPSAEREMIPEGMSHWEKNDILPPFAERRSDGNERKRWHAF